MRITKDLCICGKVKCIISKNCNKCYGKIVSARAKEKNKRTYYYCKSCGDKIAKKKYQRCHSCNMKHRWSDSEYRDRTVHSIRKSFNNRWGDPKYQQRIIKSITQFNGVSKLEKKVAKIAKNYGFISSVAIDKYLVDLLNEKYKIIVEINGDFWHCNPNMWQADDLHKCKKVPASQIWKKDNNRISHLKKMGYKVFVLWESQINKGKNVFLKNFFQKITNGQNGYTT